MADIHPFKINVQDSEIDLLKKKLSLGRIVDEPEDAGWSQGVPAQKMRDLVKDWQTTFDWRKSEAELNKMPQFTTKIEAEPKFGELDIHFVYQKSKVEGAIPLLFVHGWPGSFIEVKNILNLLTQGAEGQPTFHVVAPSLPGYGFSEAPKLKGFGLKQYATTFHKLMLKLGYNEYVTQGGDWGSMITRVQGHLFPESVKASHLNMFPTLPTLGQLITSPLTTAGAIMSFASNPSEFLGRLQKSKVFGTDGSGYSHIQSTFPQTLGYGLTDSPVALLGWIYEKLVSWTDNYPWTSDEILTWISIYWFSRAGPTASLRIYYEAFMTNALPENKDTMFCFRSYIPGPRIGLSHFPAEILPMPVKWGRFYGPVVLEKEHDRGGHFAAYEVPEKLVEDVREMFKKDGPCHGLIKGAGGY